MTAFEKVVQKLDPQNKLLRTWPMTGGVSAQVTALEIQQPDGHKQKLILRQHGAVDRKQNPHVAACEYRLLQLLHAEGLRTPVPYLLDQSGEIFGTPYVVMEYIEGTPELAPAHLADAIRQLATHLSRIHRIDGTHRDLSFLPDQAQRCAKQLSERPSTVDPSLAEARIRDALAAVWPLPQRNQSGLLHGDFWPGNSLWQDGQLTAVIDWEDAAVGDPLADVANSRLEILWAFGNDAMVHFTQQYQAMTTIDFTDLPYWDLWAALRPAGKLGDWGLTPTIESSMRQAHRCFVNQAFAQL